MTDAPPPSRPPIRWHGGKWRLAPWIIARFPPHRVYVEPYGGSASILLRKPRSYASVYNDLDGGAVGLFRVLRDPRQAAELARLVALTPFSREDFRAAHEPLDCPIEAARRLVVRSHMGHGTNAVHISSGFRANTTRAGTTPARDWSNLPPALEAAAAAFSGVVVEQRPAADVMRAHDGPETLHYVDPPYMPETRDPGGDYAFEMSREDHEDLLEFLAGLEGMVVLSGYPSDLYDDALLPRGWSRDERAALADGARPRTEILWLNSAAAAGSPQQSLDLEKGPAGAGPVGQ